MNRGNKILLGVQAFVVVCVVGYALFSETITVTGTATAKGSFDITSTCGLENIANELGFTKSDIEAYYNLGGYQNPSCSVTDSKVSFSTELLYRSARSLFLIKSENTGSINAVFDPSEVDTDGIFSNTTVEVCKLDENNVKSNCSDRFYNGDGSSNVPLESEIIGGMAKDGNFYKVDEAGFANNFKDDTYGIVLEPGESLFHAIGFYWPKNYDNDENSFNYSLEVITELKFVQTTN